MSVDEATARQHGESSTGNMQQIVPAPDVLPLADAGPHQSAVDGEIRRHGTQARLDGSDPEAAHTSNTLNTYPNMEGRTNQGSSGWNRCLIWMGSNRMITFLGAMTFALGIGGLYVAAVSYRIALRTYGVERWKDCQDRQVSITMYHYVAPVFT